MIGPAAVAGGLHAVLLFSYVAAFGGDPGSLVCVNARCIGKPPYEAVRVSVQKEGYDGQFYYALAQAPWGRNELGMDCAPMRQVRILYPALSWLLSGGDPQRLLWVMPGLNLLAIAGLAGLGAALALRGGLSPWWGVLLPLAVNVAMPALRDLTDVLSTFAIGALLVTWLLRGPWWALTLGAGAALFSREQNLAIVLAVFLGAVWRRQTLTCAGLAGALALWAGWIGVVAVRYGVWPFHGMEEGHFGLPLAGMLSRLSHLDQVPSRASAAVHLVSLLLLLFEIGLAVYLALHLVRLRADLVLPLVTLAGAALALLGGFILYEDHWGYSRLFAWLPLGLWLTCAHLRWRWPLVLTSVPVMLPLAALAKVWLGAV
jgi:hypothetical protein